MGDALHVSGGVTDAKEARLAQGGLIAVQGPTALDARTGVLAGPGSTTLVTGTSSTGPMTVSIGPHVAVTTRGSANGAYLGPVLEAATTVSIAAAPASGSRIDVVYAKQQDATSGVPSPDVSTAPVYGVLQGTSGSSPTKPSLAAVVGAEELATVQVAAGATSTNGAGVTITNTARQTVARGARVIWRNAAERTAQTGYVGLQGFQLDTGQVWEWRNVLGTELWTWPKAAQGQLARANFVDGSNAPTPLQSAPAVPLGAFNVTVPEIAPGRRIKVTFTPNIMADTANTVFGFVAILAGVQHRWFVHVPVASTTGNPWPVSQPLVWEFDTTTALTAPTGGITAAARFSGAGTCYLVTAGVDGPTQFLVEDIGGV